VRDVPQLWWSDAQAAYLRRRSARYPGALDIEPAWTVEAAADAHAIVRDPDPRSRTDPPAVRIIGWSPSAGCVLTIIARATDWAGVTAWKTTGADLRAYLEGSGGHAQR
jgi:hypothetical protein